MGSKKLCPVQYTRKEHKDEIRGNIGGEMECDEGGCAWWVLPAAVEDIPEGGSCAIKVIGVAAELLGLHKQKGGK